MFHTIFSEYKFKSGRERANCFKVLYSWLFDPTFRVNVWIAYMQNVNSIILKKLISNHLETKYSILVSPHCKIGKHLRVDHFFGVVIGKDVIIGDYCKIYQQVTLGQKNGEYPVVGNNVVIYPGAKIIGGITIGDNTQIGTNAVVLTNVPANSIAVGIPARIL